MYRSRCRANSFCISKMVQQPVGLWRTPGLLLFLWVYSRNMVVCWRFDIVMWTCQLCNIDKYCIHVTSVKSCSLDLMPTFLLCEHVNLFTPFVTAIVNASLSQGRLPDSQKHAIVLPLLKKPDLDTADMANFRTVSNLSFLSKVKEKVVARQANSYLTENGLLPCCQSAYRRHHLTQTAMLRVLSDALTAVDSRQVTLLGMLDLSAAFDCFDHLILLQRLERNFYSSPSKPLK